MHIYRINRYSIQQILLIICTAIYFYQVIGERLINNQNYINLFVFIAWLLIATITSLTTFINTFKKTKYTYLYLFLFFVLITGIFSGYYVSTMKFMVGFIITISPIIIYDYLNLYNKTKVNKLILVISLVILSYYSISTNIFIQKYPTIARQLASGSEYIKSFYYGLNIGGGYNLIYGLTFLVILLVLYRPEKKSTRFITLLLIILFTYTLLNAGYFIAIIFTICGIILVKISRNKSVLLLLSFFTLFAFSLLYIAGFFDYVGHYILSISSNRDSLFSGKLYELGNFLVGNQSYSYEHIEGRTSRALISLKSFFINPLVGSGIVTGYNTNIEIGIVGQHSEWIDALARYGIIGTYLYMSFFIVTIREYTRKNNKKLYILFFIFFVLGFLNPVRVFTIIFVLFFVSTMLLNDKKMVEDTK